MISQIRRRINDKRKQVCPLKQVGSVRLEKWTQRIARLPCAKEELVKPVHFWICCATLIPESHTHHAAFVQLKPLHAWRMPVYWPELHIHAWITY